MPHDLAVGHCDRTRKLAYASQAKAKRASVLIRSRAYVAKLNRPYLCPFCHLWHTTSAPLRGRSA